jgi:site-specific recombinase XerC
VHDLQEELSPPSVKQHLAAIRMLFDWLVTGHVIDTNPAHSVRGPRIHGQERQDAGPNA